MLLELITELLPVNICDFTVIPTTCDRWQSIPNKQLLMKV